MRQIILILLLGILLASGAFYFRSELSTAKKASPKLTQTEKVWPVRVTSAQRGTHEIYRIVYGRVVAEVKSKPGFRIDGCIEHLGANIKVGASVKHNQLFMKLDTDRLEISLKEAQNNIAEAEAQLEEIRTKLQGFDELFSNAQGNKAFAMEEVERKRKLNESGSISSREFENALIAQNDAETTLIQLEREKASLVASLNTQKQRVKSRQQGLESAKLNLDYAVLTASHDGIIASVLVEQGDCVRAHNPVVELIGTDTIVLELKLPVYLYMAIAGSQNLVGGLVEAFSGELDNVVKSSARIVRVAPQIDDTTQMITLYAEPLNNTTKTALTPGAFVRARILAQRLEDAISLPSSALFDGDTIYAVEDDRLVPYSVELLARDDDTVFITGEISAGAEILTTRLQFVTPGLKVKVIRN